MAGGWTLHPWGQQDSPKDTGSALRLASHIAPSCHYRGTGLGAGTPLRHCEGECRGGARGGKDGT